jgi:hypothetical protein
VPQWPWQTVWPVVDDPYSHTSPAQCSSTATATGAAKRDAVVAAVTCHGAWARVDHDIFTSLRCLWSFYEPPSHNRLEFSSEDPETRSGYIQTHRINVR